MDKPGKLSKRLKVWTFRSVVHFAGGRNGAGLFQPAPQKLYIPVVRLELIREQSVDIPVERVSDSLAVYEIGSRLIGHEDREHFLVLCLTAKSTVTAINTVSIGTLDCTLVHPREVFKSAVLSNSHAIILMHNHPSGDPEPSPDDIEITERLVATGEILGIPVMDHVIVGNGTFVSFKERGLI